MELRLLTLEHVGAVAELISEPDVLRFTRIPEPPPEDFARTWVAGYERRRAAGDAEAFAILGDDGALGLMTRWAFGKLGMRGLTLTIDVDNPASKRVAERCAYTREGVLRSTYFEQGRRTDVELWSRLPSDPAPGTTAP